MNPRFYLENKIEDYLLGNLSEAETNSFERLVEQDPILQGELQFQKETIESIRWHRKRALKDRMNNIEITQRPLNYLFGTRLLGIAAISSVVITGFALLFNNTSSLPLVHPGASKKITLLHAQQEERKRNSFDNQNTQEKAQEEEIKTPVLKTVMTTYTTPLLPQNKSNISEESIEEIEPKSIKLATLNKVDSLSKAKVLLKVVGIGKPETKVAFEIKDTDEDKGVFDGKDVESLEDMAAKNTLSYQLYPDEKLFLYNNRHKGKHIIYEQEGVERHFLYYEGKYYKLNLNQIEITQVEEVTDEVLIEQLDQKMHEQYGH